jgi:hypothetical protein
VVCLLVSLDSLARGVEATQGMRAAHLSLVEVERKDKTNHICLERAVFYYRSKMAGLCGSSATRAQHIHINTSV